MARSSVEGVPELLRKFDQLKAETRQKALRTPIRRAANLVAEEAAGRIPVGSRLHRTYRGALVAPGYARRSIKVVTYLNRRTGGAGAMIGVSAQAFYAVQFVELERGKSTARGRPWLRPAFDDTTDAQIAEFIAAFRRTIRRLTKK